MELRSNNHLHFIQAVKGGVITKHLNVLRGKPALMFKTIKDLYEIEDTTNFELYPAYRPKFECSDYPIDWDWAKAESLYAPKEETTKTSVGETSVSNSKGDAGEDRNSEDLNFGSMTLKQIKERCKEKKRKQSKYVDETVKTCSLREQNHINSQPDDEFDIMEPLSCWKSRILNKKTKRKCRKKSVSASSQDGLTIIKCENIPSDQVIIQPDGNFPAPIAIKVENPESPFSGCKDSIVSFVESPLSCDEPMISRGAVSSEELKTPNSYDLTSERVSEEPCTTKCYVSETGMSLTPGEPLAANACGLEIHMPSSFGKEPPCNAVNVVSSGTGISVGSVEELTTDACGLETLISAFFTDEPRCCAASGESYGYVEDADPNSIIDIQGSRVENIANDISEAICHQFSDLSLLEAKKEDIVMEQCQKNNFQKTVCASENHVPIMYNDTQSSPCAYLKWQKTSSNSQVQVPDAISDNILEFEELNARSGSCLSEDEAKDDILHVQASIISSPIRDCGAFWNSNLSSSPNCSSVCAVDPSLRTEEKTSLSSDFAGAATHCPAVNYSYTDEPVLSAKVDNHSKLHHPPERLFSTRMAISPTSQKRLREDMAPTELDDEQFYKYARKLCYRNLVENKISRVEGGNQIKRAEVITSPKKASRKAKIDNNGFHHNGNAMVPHGSRFLEGIGPEYESVRSCSESAILFSQQQMRDIESVATKLSKELQFMKDIAEQTLQQRVNPDTSLRHSDDEIRIAVQNATRVEENARRGLSIMARNCNRFCKIMKLADKGSGTSRNTVRKKRKIVFADEAGGKLCDVKTFENDVCSFIEAKGE